MQAHKRRIVSAVPLTKEEQAEKRETVRAFAKDVRKLLRPVKKAPKRNAFEYRHAGASSVGRTFVTPIADRPVSDRTVAAIALHGRDVAPDALSVLGFEPRAFVATLSAEATMRARRGDTSAKARPTRAERRAKAEALSAHDREVDRFRGYSKEYAETYGEKTKAQHVPTVTETFTREERAIGAQDISRNGWTCSYCHKRHEAGDCGKLAKEAAKRDEKEARAQAREATRALRKARKAVAKAAE